jgi:outer membrane protein OmpA-like peptidoglycan-associated protein/Tol biopolymer transport system component
MKNLFIILLIIYLIPVSAQLTAPSYSVKNLRANSEYSDFGTTFFGKNKIVFSSSRGNSISNKKWDGNDQPFLDLYIGDVKPDGEIERVKPFSRAVNSKYHDALVTFSPDMTEVYFTSNNYLHGELKSGSIKIFRATIDKNGQWKNFKTLPFNSDNYDTGHPVLNEDGTKLYFTSNMPGGFGDTDLYVVAVNEDHYGAPVNLGNTINSKYKEYTPYIDGNVLYFSSNRKGGSGGFDIYMTKLDKSIPKPINLKKPMNSRSDDISFIINNETQKGYFSSNRSGGMGDDDIYSFKQETINPICDQIATGVIVDKITGLPIQNAFATLYDSGGKKIRRIETMKDGKFKFELDCGDSYKITGSKFGYFDFERTIETSQENGYNNELTIVLDEKEFVIVNNKEMLNIVPIEFELNQAKIKEESKDELAKVVRLMRKYPKMVIEFGAHTDARGGDTYNLRLTQRRAIETVNYLISLGADQKKITGKGYGETELTNHCKNNVKCTEIEHLQNRRTEFVVIAK